MNKPIRRYFRKDISKKAYNMMMLALTALCLYGFISERPLLAFLISWLIAMLFALSDYVVNEDGVINEITGNIDIILISKIVYAHKGIYIYFIPRTDGIVKRRHYFPKNREAFIRCLLKYNPNIEVSKDMK